MPYRGCVTIWPRVPPRVNQLSGPRSRASPTRRLWNGFPILPRIGCAVVDACPQVSHHGLAASHDFRVVTPQHYLVAARGESLANSLRYAVLHIDIAPIESHLGETRRL